MVVVAIVLLQPHRFSQPLFILLVIQIKQNGVMLFTLYLMKICHLLL